MAKRTSTKPEPEILAISEVYQALEGLESDAQARILKYVADKLKVGIATTPADSPARTTVTEGIHYEGETEHAETKDEVDEESEGISPGGRKWITRNGLQASQLSLIFSLGGDEIDLIAKKVPGNSKAKRMRSVLLLKGLAAYLGTGAARFTYQEAKETSLHYDAFDSNNPNYAFKHVASEVSGTKETGYTLTPRGIASATELVKEMVTLVQPTQ
jgi:hypothetical protein